MNFKLDLELLIVQRLAERPVGKRGPKTSILSDTLLSYDNPDVCWPWLGRVGSNGYGLALRPGSRTKGTTAHRVVWELLFGPVADDLQVDHLCHDPGTCAGGDACPHRRCVNPTHLGLKTPRENTLRSNSLAALNAEKTECSQGHEFTPENTYTDPGGRRNCRTCFRAHWRRYYAERKSAS